MFGSLLKAAAAVVDVPVSLAADAATMGGALTDKDSTYTGEALDRLVKNAADAAKPKGGR